MRAPGCAVGLVTILLLACDGGGSSEPFAVAGRGGSSGAGGAAGIDCGPPLDDYCVAKCSERSAWLRPDLCSNGSWTCAPGLVLVSTCESDACAVTLDGCCDLTTGTIAKNPCSTDGTRPACPAGSHEDSVAQSGGCIPVSVTSDCISLDDQPCNGPALECHDWSFLQVTCECRGLDAQPPSGKWQCRVFDGG